MLFAATPADYQVCRPEVDVFGGYQEVKYAGKLSSLFSVTRRAVGVIRLGRTFYRLRNPTEGTFYSGVTAPGGEFLVDGFPRPFLGCGPKPEEAYQDWIKQFHAIFQRLYGMRDFEMDEADRRLWGVIENQIDVEEYRTRQPLILTQQGSVVRARSYPEVILWEDGTRERVHLARMPGEFASYRAGQPFEAVVHRDPVSYKIRKVDYVKRLRSPKSLTEEESKRLWDSLPTSGSLPDTDWD